MKRNGGYTNVQLSSLETTFDLPRAQRNYRRGSRLQGTPDAESSQGGALNRSARVKIELVQLEPYREVSKLRTGGREGRVQRDNARRERTGQRRPVSHRVIY